MKLSDSGIDFIAKHEGIRYELYDDKTGKTIKRADDATGFPTIGIGHLVKPGENFDGVKLTRDQVMEIFRKDVVYFEDVINRQNLKLTQNQFDALVSFVYNVGEGKKGVKDGLVTLRNGNPSSLLRYVRAGNMAAAADEFLKWTRSGGVQLRGLVTRRGEERALFLRA